MHSLSSVSDDQASHSTQLQLEYFVWLLNRMPYGGIPVFTKSPAVDVQDDIPLVTRIMASYKIAMQDFRPSDSPWDTGLLDIKKVVCDAFSGTNIGDAASVLRDPASSTFFWGFDAIATSPVGEIEPH